MPIPAQCQCGAKFAAPDHLAGKSVACPKCKQPLQIPPAGDTRKAPAKQASTGESSSPAKQQASKQQSSKRPAAGQATSPAVDGKIPTRCGCGATFAAPAKLAGKRVACPTCKQPVTIPSRGQQTAGPRQQAQQPAASSGDGLDDLLDEVGVEEGKKAGQSYCPECSAPFPEEAVLCVHCGYSRKTGKQMKTQKVKKAPSRAVDLSAPPRSGMPGAYDDMVSSRQARPPRPVGATILSVLHGLGVGLFALLTVLMVLVSGLILSFIAEGGGEVDGESVSFFMFGLLVIDIFLIMLVQFTLCVGYWMGKSLAWYLGISWYVFSAVNSVIEVIGALLFPGEEPVETAELIGTLVGRGGIGILLPLGIVASMFGDNWQQFFGIEEENRNKYLGIALGVVALWTLLEHLVFNSM